MKIHWPTLAIIVLLQAVAVAEEPSPEPLSGTWLVAQKLASEADVPVIGGVRSDTWVVGYVSLAENGRRLSGEGPICSMWVDGPPAVHTEIPAALRKAVSPLKVAATVGRTVDGVRLTQPAEIVVHGARVRDPKRSPLPTSPRDSRVVDSDRDGKPGMTVRISGLVTGDIHVVQRGSMSWKADQTSKGWFRGNLRFSQEQVVLSATSRWLKDPPASKPLPRKSWIWLIPHEGAIDCGVASREISRLIPGASR